MKKHLIAILIIFLVLCLTGGIVFIIVKNNKITPLYKASCDFILSEDTELLSTKINQSQELYNVIISGDSRLTTLNSIISKIDSFEKDLNSYLILSNAKPKTTKSLSKSYSSLNKYRKQLLTDYDEYITRMSGNINADGPMVQNLYNDVFNKTVQYIYKYNTCFNATYTFVFNKVYTARTIKNEAYLLYTLGVNDLLNNISNNNFSSTTLITRLNNGLNLTNGNIEIRNSVIGGEFGSNALNFKKYFNSCNHTNLIENFNTYYSTSINPNIETSYEKLAVYYAKQIWEI